ncbi:HET-domain-containing protein [Trichoderma citrinoviride]|uniref:HET-domain-containing protein n=1 Tax=Trichoderma citrinoviride TaxID=58853 RepID=A0A2T4B0D3_9HYPO|nr:HET-domain-containing protein [Trichoderma citrinoviride]PTB62784.1 HET-domain-containing protein [Trichoderma citrinoviride]
MPVFGEPLVDDPSSDPTQLTRWSYASPSDPPLPDEDVTQPFCPRHAVTIAHLNKNSFGPHKTSSTPPHRDRHFGNLDYVLSRRDWCRVCGLIANVVLEDPANSLLDSKNADLIACWIWDGVLDDSSTDMGTLRLRIAPEMIGWEDSFEPFDLVPLADEEAENKLFMGRRIGETRFDLELVKGWVNHCAEWHGHECLDTTPWQTLDYGVSFIRMVSLNDCKLIETSCPPPYVALSYVWGSAPVFKTTQSNISDLMQHQGLPVSSLPKSIRDAMTLAQELGFEYIWIDSLCIIQDSGDDKVQQLRMMDSIYSRASLTIVAAAGSHANAGILGLQPGTRSRKQHIVQVSDDLALVALHPDTQRSAAATTWYTRGWTYQELLLSKRCLYSFPDGSVSFQCSRAVWGEDYYAETPHLKRCAPMLDISLNRSWSHLGSVRERGAPTVHVKDTPYLHEYSRLVEAYTGRNMSYASDRLAGISGVLDVLQREFGLYFLHGLPEVLIHMALLWQPRNKLKRVPKDDSTGLPLYPSWSWTGWTGPVGYEDWNAFNSMPELEDRAKRPVNTPGQPPCLSLRTRKASFRLTNLILSPYFKTDDYPIEQRGRFGLSLPSPSEGDRPWLGTILLPVQYHAKMAQDHEFIILSESYGFHRNEVAATAEQMKPFEIYDVMMIRRVVGEELALYRAQLAGICEQGSTGSWLDGKSVVERIGVGRMLKSAWSGDGDWEDFILV